MIKTVTNVWHRRSIVRHFVSMLLTTSYRTKSLGFLWALLDPLLFMAVYYLVFAVIVAHRKPWFMLHIYIGIISFRFLSTSIAKSSQILKGQAGLIREIAFPKASLPVAVVVTRFFDFLAGWAAAIVIAFIFHVPPDAMWLLLPLLVLIQFCFVMGLSLITAYIGVFFADIANLIDVGMRLWFYLSPVLYLLNTIQGRIRENGHPLLYELYLLNPMTSILQNYEYVVFWHHPWMLDQAELLTKTSTDSLVDPMTYLIRSLVAAVVVLVIGIYVFSRAEGRISKYV